MDGAADARCVDVGAAWMGGRAVADCGAVSGLQILNTGSFLSERDADSLGTNAAKIAMRLRIGTLSAHISVVHVLYAVEPGEARRLLLSCSAGGLLRGVLALETEPADPTSRVVRRDEHVASLERAQAAAWTQWAKRRVRAGRPLTLPPSVAGVLRASKRQEMEAVPDVWPRDAPVLLLSWRMLAGRTRPRGRVLVVASSAVSCLSALAYCSAIDVGVL